jgi:hypothetical protein
VLQGATVLQWMYAEATVETVRRIVMLSKKVLTQSSVR